MYSVKLIWLEITHNICVCIHDTIVMYIGVGEDMFTINTDFGMELEV